MSGILLSIYLAKGKDLPQAEVQSARAVPGRGLEGDRYFEGQGSYSDRPGEGRQITLIEMEAIEAVRKDYALEVTPGETRRNLVTRGIALNHLVGREFKVGAVRLLGKRLCEPCGHLEELLAKPRFKLAFVHRGGLRCDVLSDGEIHAGDAITIS